MDSTETTTAETTTNATTLLHLEPDLTDRATVLALAMSAANAYTLPDKGDWLRLDGNWKTVRTYWRRGWGRRRPWLMSRLSLSCYFDP